MYCITSTFADLLLCWHHISVLISVYAIESVNVDIFAPLNSH